MIQALPAFFYFFVYGFIFPKFVNLYQFDILCVINSEKQPYIAPQELVDEVKLNVSVLKPHHEQDFMNTVNLFQQHLTDQYGEYIPESKKEIHGQFELLLRKYVENNEATNT